MSEPPAPYEITDRPELEVLRHLLGALTVSLCEAHHAVERLQEQAARWSPEERAELDRTLARHGWALSHGRRVN